MFYGDRDGEDDLGMALLAAPAANGREGEAEGQIGRWQYSLAGGEGEWRDLPEWLAETVTVPPGLMTEKTYQGPVRVGRYLERAACEVEDGADVAVAASSEVEARRWREVRPCRQTLDGFYYVMLRRDSLRFFF